MASFQYPTLKWSDTPSPETTLDGAHFYICKFVHLYQVQGEQRGLIASRRGKRQFFLRKQVVGQTIFTLKSAPIARKINSRQNRVKCILQKVWAK